ncbi:phosphoserine aminotransferase [Gammaproteobacteria bacterium]
MSSTLLSRPIEVSRYGLIYAGAQKNIGPAGLTIVIIRKDLLVKAPAVGPLMLDYKIHAENQSMYNTPPTYSWYIANLVFEWLEKKGGLAKMAEANRKKSEKLYSYIDTSGFYQNPVEVSCRSWMNIPFTLPRAEMDSDFLEGAKKVGLLALKGHKLVGGMRASLYNAMPEAGVDALIEYMKAFSARHGKG